MLNPRFTPIIAISAGGIAALGFAPHDLWPLTIIGTAVLLALVDTAASSRSAAWRGWLFGIGHFTTGLTWIATAFTYQAKMPAWLGWVTVVLLAMFLALYVALAAGLVQRLGKRPLARVLVFAALWMLGEWLRGHVLSGFAWNPLGAAWLPAPGIAQLARFGGSLGLSGLMVLAAGGVWMMLRRGSSRRQRLSGTGLALGIVAVGVIGNGLDRLHYVHENSSVVLIQPNIGQDEKYTPGADEAHLQSYLDLTTEALSGASNDVGRVVASVAEPDTWAGVEFGTVAPAAALPTDPAPVHAVAGMPAHLVPPVEPQTMAIKRPGAIVIWSESAVPFAVEEDAGVRARLAAVLGPDDLLLFGGVAVIRDTAGTVTALTNSLFVLDAKGRIRGRYDKAHLVPLGEYVPARGLMTALGVARLAPGDLDFRPGDGPKTLDLPSFPRVGVQICYEIIFPGTVVDAAKRPAWVVNISNDAWFGPSGPPQHLAQARLRAIEEGLPIARVTPTGISAIIDAHGHLSAVLAAGERGAAIGALPPALPPTPFALLGHWLSAGFALLLLLAGIGYDRARQTVWVR